MSNVTIHPPGGPSQAPVAPQAAAAPPAQSPSQRVVDEANALRFVTDRDGRRLGWRPLDALEDFDLSEVAGGTNVSNAKWMMYAMMAFACRTIDDQPLSRPLTRDQLRARVKLLGAAGLDALFSSMVPEAQNDDAGGDNAAAPNEIDRVKNS